MNDTHDAERIAEALEAVSVIPYPALGIDLDGPLDDQAIFFRLLAHHWPGKVIGFSTVSVRGTELIVEQLKLHCDDVIVAESADRYCSQWCAGRRQPRFQCGHRASGRQSPAVVRHMRILATAA